MYLKDIIERNNLKNSEEFMELMRVMASCIGSPCNPNKLENTFKSVKNETLDRKTRSKYLSYMEDAFLIEKSMCLIREKVVTFRMVKLNMLLSIFLITK